MSLHCYDMWHLMISGSLNVIRFTVCTYCEHIIWEPDPSITVILYHVCLSIIVFHSVSVTKTLKNITSMLPGITVLGNYFNACWRESAKPLLFFCSTMPVSLLVDQRKILFKKQPAVAILFWVPCANYIIMTYRNWHPPYSISSLNTGNTDIKMAIWCHFTSSFTL